MQGSAMLASDALALVFAFLGSAVVASIVNIAILNRPYMEFLAENGVERAIQFGVLGGILLLRLHLKGHHRQRLPFWTQAQDVVMGCALLLLIDVFLLFAVKLDFSRLWLVTSWVLSALAILAGRRLTRGLLEARGMWRIPVLLVGGDPDVRHAREALASEPNLGYEVIGTIDMAEVKRAVSGGSWTRLSEDRGARLVVLALSNAEMVERGTLLSDLVREHLPFAVIPPLKGLPILGFDRLYFIGHDVMMMVARNNLAQPLSRAAKLAFDIAVAAALSVLLLPVFAVLVVLIARDGGPVLYRHRRVGRGGRSFDCLKFRTMVVDADRVLADLLASDPAAAAEWHGTFKLRNDPRVTPIGRLLRRTSLDELPQLLNVLRCEMSLVGPRPITEEELPFYGRDVHFYLETRPGITGLWQVSGRSDTSYDQRVLYDTWYVKNWSLWHDIAILSRTVPVVIGRIGAT